MKKVFLLLICGFLFSCSEKQLNVDEPFKNSIEAKSHTLWFSISYPSHELENWLNRKFDRTIVDKDIAIRNGKDTIRVIITKPEKIKLTTIGDSVDIVFPLSLEVIGDKEKRSGKVKKRRAEGAITLHLNIKPKVNKEWDIIAKSIIKSHKWTKEPQLEFGGMKIGVKFITDHFLKNELSSITRELDKALEEKVDLKKGINRTWQNIQRPLPIINNDTVSVYFKIDPRRISGKIMVQPKGFLFRMAVNCRTLINTNKDSLLAAKTLPPFNALTSFKPDSNKLEVLATVPLLFINQELVHVLGEFKYENMGVSLKVKDIKAMGAAEKIALKLKVTGTANGTITMIGQPFYDKEKQVLFIKDLDYDLETDHVVVKLLDKKLKENLLAYVTKNVVLGLGKYIDGVPEYLNQTVNQGRSADKFDLKFNDFDIENIEYHINETDLQILLKCKPKFDITLKKLPIKRKLKIR